MRPIYYFIMGMMTGIAIFGIEFICITALIKVRDRFQKIDDMGRELERLKRRQGVIDDRLRNCSSIKQRMEEVLRLHEIEVKDA